MNWLTTFAFFGAIVPPAALTMSVASAGLSLNLLNFTLGTVFFLACLGILAIPTLREKGDH